MLPVLALGTALARPGAWIRHGHVCKLGMNVNNRHIVKSGDGCSRVPADTFPWWKHLFISLPEFNYGRFLSPPRLTAIQSAIKPVSNAHCKALVHPSMAQIIEDKQNRYSHLESHWEKRLVEGTKELFGQTLTPPPITTLSWKLCLYFLGFFSCNLLN